VKHTATYILKTLSIFILLGFSYQFISTKIDAYTYSPFGEFVDIGGYKLHFYKTGIDSGPTIVLDMGMGGNLLYWNIVQDEISKFARVVSYDRSGIGWSDKRPQKLTSQNIVEELHALLHKANIPKPYILVGHSFSGINARIFANKYPNEVSGIILVDSSHEEQIKKLPRQRDIFSILLNSHDGHTILLGLTALGITRLYNRLTYDYKLPDKIRNMLLATNSTTQFMHSFIDEWSIFPSTLEYVSKTGQNLADKPLVVITAGMQPDDKECARRGFDNISCQAAYNTWQVLQKNLVTKSTRSKQIIAENSGHNIPVDAPHVIVDAVKAMLRGNI